jgi:hypothetical protein
MHIASEIFTQEHENTYSLTRIKLGSVPRADKNDVAQYLSRLFKLPVRTDSFVNKQGDWDFLDKDVCVLAIQRGTEPWQYAKPSEKEEPNRIFNDAKWGNGTVKTVLWILHPTDCPPDPSQAKQAPQDISTVEAEGAKVLEETDAFIEQLYEATQWAKELLEEP